MTDTPATFRGYAPRSGQADKSPRRKFGLRQLPLFVMIELSSDSNGFAVL